jgi:nucleotide-binding universal stress UspA family protein
MIPRTFVVPLDGSDFATRALAVGRSFAWRVDGRVLVVSVAPEHDAGGARRRVRELVQSQQPVDTEVLFLEPGDPASAILSVTSNSDDHMICMTSHGRGGLRWAILGSVAEKVMQASARPILLVGRNCGDHVGNGPLLVGDDGSDAAEAIADDALFWAKTFGFDLEVAVVIHPLDIENAAHPEPLLEPVVDRFHRRGVDVQPTVLRSEYTAGALADHAASIGASMIATAKHSRPPHQRLALGSVTMGVLNAAPCPLLVAHA